MRVDGNSAYDKKDETKRKWTFRYTMVTVIIVLLVMGAAIIAFQTNPWWTAKDDENRIDMTREPDNYYRDEGGLDVIQPVPTVDSQDTPTPAKEPKKQEKSGKDFAFPVKGGKVILDYSGNELVYSKTLDQYVVHNGVDIEAPADSQVLAVKEGTVTKVYNDDKLGITIELTHGDGYVTRYSNLSTDKMVEEGDVVKTGEVISGVGSTALFESLDSPHLHFEVWQKGAPIDPAKYIDL
ncbi:MAG: M23 family metallopeptidase [Eubacteriales bacterium]|nr:M23 family metallopeptidase [Eubacteriales bacterium]MDD4582904.1 M23 family metallopeptidase [Eubacteriales bacterium]